MIEDLTTALSPSWSTRIVDLRVYLSNEEHKSSDVAAKVNQILDSCACLHTFHCNCCAVITDDHRQAAIVHSNGYAGQLAELRLSGFRCQEIDLKVLLHLTSISLTRMDSCSMHCKLIWPSNLQRLEFCGSTLFSQGTKCNLEGLTNLVHLTLGTLDPELYFPELDPGNFDLKQNELENSAAACMPTLPSSLRHLRVTCSSVEHLLDCAAQRCLRFCTNLEHLTLPRTRHVDGSSLQHFRCGRELTAWLKATRHVHYTDRMSLRDY